MNRRRSLYMVLAVCVFLAALAAPAAAVTYYVDPNGSADFTTIQAAIDDPCTVNGDEIEVAPGTYYEAIDFKGKGVRLYSRDGRDVTTIDANGAYHTVQCVSSEDANTILAGFTITGGSATNGGGMYCNNSSPTVTDCNFTGNWAKYGGGMANGYCSPTVTDCIFTANMASNGGGMYNDGSPTVTNCTFSGNSASSDGGGMYNNGSFPRVTNCTFTSNTADLGGGMCNRGNIPTLTNCTFNSNKAHYGGGMVNSSSSPTLTNCTFNSNSADGVGGMYNFFSSSPTVTNCTFSGNSSALGGGGMRNWSSSSPTVTNCILWGNTPDEICNSDAYSTPTVTFSDVQGGYPGTGNIDADPCFVDTSAPDPNLWNLRLMGVSTCIDAGDNASVPPDTADLDGDGNAVEPIPFDLGGLPRFVDDLCTGDTGNGAPPVVDMGAYEYLPADIDGSGAVDLGDFCQFALHWAQTGCGRCGGANMDCDADADWSDLAELVDWWLAGP